MDPGLNRRIEITKRGGAAAVVWNPWTTQPLADLAPGEYRSLVCVESGSIRPRGCVLLPGASATVGVTLKTSALR